MVIVAVLIVGLAGFRRWRGERDLTVVSYGVDDILPPYDSVPDIYVREPPPRDPLSDPEYLALIAEVKPLIGRHNWFGRGRACAKPAISIQFGRTIEVWDNPTNQAAITELLDRKRPGGPTRPLIWGNPGRKSRFECRRKCDSIFRRLPPAIPEWHGFPTPTPRATSVGVEPHGAGVPNSYHPAKA